MNTLKMKVLLILTNRHLWQSVKQALFIWFATAIVGSFAVGAVNSTIPELSVFGLSLFFSSPAIIVAIPVLYILPTFHDKYLRAIFSIFSILVVSAFIIGIVTSLSGLEYLAIAEILFPYIPSATVCFFSIAGKQIIKPYYVNN